MSSGEAVHGGICEFCCLLFGRLNIRADMSGALQMFHRSFCFIIVVPGYFREIGPHYMWSVFLRKAPSGFKGFYSQVCSRNSEIPPVKAGFLAGEFALAIKRRGDL